LKPYIEKFLLPRLTENAALLVSNEKCPISEIGSQT
jgi:hypothetical protein